MGKSYRRTPAIGWSKAESEKRDKQIANAKFRKKAKQKLHSQDLDGMPHNLDEVFNKSEMAKDGRQYLSEESQADGSWRRK